MSRYRPRVGGVKFWRLPPAAKPKRGFCTDVSNRAPAPGVATQKAVAIAASSRRAAGTRPRLRRELTPGKLSGGLRLPGLQAGLPGNPADEERAQPVEVQRRLLGLPHALDDHRERLQLRADETDHEVVVVLVQSVTGKADVVAEPCAAEGLADSRVLHQDDILFVARKPLERTRAPQWVPDRPR